MFSRTLTVALGLALLAGRTGFAQPQRCQRGDSRFRIAALYMNTDARQRLFAGMLPALAEHGPIGTPVCIVDMPYNGTDQGPRLLLQSIQGEAVDLIIGPTESDIFVRALEQRDALTDHGVPVISPLITAEVEQDPKGWFFRTNVGVRGRAQVVYDYLRKLWIRSIAVLYADTEFGRQAEAAFKDEYLTEFGCTGTYTSEPYDPPPSTRVELWEVLKQRSAGMKEACENCSRTGGRMCWSESSTS